MTGWVRGIDVSHYQPPAVITDRAAAGDRFAFVKVSEGTRADKVNGAHGAAASHAGIAAGGYHFYRSSVDPVRQAQVFCAELALSTWGLPPVLDYENQSGAESPGRLLSFLEEVERRTGRVPIVYSNAPWWAETIGNDRRFARFPFWLAKYPYRYEDGATLPPFPSMPSAPAPWVSPAIWQYSTTSGRLDRNVMTPQAFATLTRAVPVPVPDGQKFPGVIHSGDRGQRVQDWAWILRLCGYNGFIVKGESGKVFKVGKVAATRRFQKARGLPVTGIVDKATWDAGVARAKAKKAGAR